MDPQNIDIRILLPQQPPMVMVDRLVFADEKSAETMLNIRQDNVFVENGVLKSYAIIENMAQTCAAQLGYMRYLSGNHDVRIGYVGSVKRMHIDAAPKVGETLTTHIVMLEEVMDMKLVSSKSYIDDRLIATAEMSIVLSGENIKV
jgi:predicted hotdog family 3-hydroxylacyl-ACP dehydratase